ncbi:MAG: hypothetical protein AAGM04_10070 [Pseudomonadota bacterium]
MSVAGVLRTGANSSRTIAALLIAFSVAGCQSAPPPVAKQTQSPRSVMLNVGKQVQKCWFKGKDRAFRSYRMADELNSYTGRPRVLIVPKNNPGGLPKLVAEAERKGGTVRFSAYGPLIDGADGARFNAALESWARGSRAC